MKKFLGILIFWTALLGGGAVAYKVFFDGSGKRIKPGAVVEVPFIFWGGDVAAFHANGGLETTSDSLFAKQGLKVKLTPGDDFDAQVKNYLSNKTPFLRGTLSMIGQASDELTKSKATTPVVFLQLTWSAGDHLVGRGTFRDLNGLRGKKIALQRRGPHVGMLNDILITAKLTWKDVTVVWTADVSGEKGPAQLFRTDPTIDGCFAISPEMFELTSAPDTGGVTSVGTGTGKSVKGAQVVVSTAHMARSIADVYAVRKDFYDANKDYCEKFAAAYIKACEELVQSKKTGDPTYHRMVKLAQDIWSKDDALRDAVKKFEDVDGLIADANFVGLPGNQAFFSSKGNLSGFPFKMAQAVALPADPSREPLRLGAVPLPAPEIDYATVRKLGDLHGKAPTLPRILDRRKSDEEQTIFEFIIRFDQNSFEFPEAKYGPDFQRALEQASLFGNAVVAVRGHSDTGRLVERFIRAAGRKGILSDGRLNGKSFDPGNIRTILQTIKDHPDLTFNEPVKGEDKAITLPFVVSELKVLSDRRADNVLKSVKDYSRSRGLLLDDSQLRYEAAGVEEPVHGDPRTDEQRAANRRVQFAIVKVSAGKVNAGEFELE